MATYTKHIALLEQAELKVIEAMAEGGAAAQQFEIRGRMVKFRDLPDELLKIRNLIAIYKDQDSGTSPGTGRTRARITRD